MILATPQVQGGATLADLGLIVPELILVAGTSLVLLAARWIQRGRVAIVVAVVAALAAGTAACVLPGEDGAVGFGGMLAADGYSRFFKVLMAAALGVTALLSVRDVDGEHVPRAEYNALLLMAATGMMLTAGAIDLLTLYLSLELVTLCAYSLVGITVEKPASNEAAIKYFLLGSFSSALLLFGISLTYGVTGATDFASIAAALEAPATNPLLIAAIGLLAAGFAFKIAAVPFHAWAPDAYQGALAPVAGFLAAGSKAAGLAALCRVALVAFPAQVHVLTAFLAALAALSIVVGSVVALPQTNLKRLLAYSSIAHAGYALLGLVAGTAAGVEATMTYAFFYVFMTLGAFGIVIALGPRGESIGGYRGLAAQRPVAAGLMLLFLLSLTGIPPTAGFVAKFAVIASAVGAEHYALAVLAVLCSVITAFVYLRVAVLMYMHDPEAGVPRHFPAAIAVALAVAALVTLFGGLSPASVTRWVVSP